jgi:FkbM family methyltransferase
MSRVLPKMLTFRLFLMARGLELQLRKAGSPQIIQKMVDHLYYSLQPSIIQTSFRGWIFHIRLNDPFHYDLLLGDHEPAVTNWLAHNVGAGMTIFDVGANIGSFTMFMASLVGEQGRVFALEADPKVCEILQANIRANGFRMIHPIRGAAYWECGEVSLGRAEASSGYSGLYYQKASEWISVPAFTLDSLVEKYAIKRVDLVKIDVEGAEWDVLEGMRNLLQTARPRLLIELHVAAVPRTREIPEWLRRKGYSVEFLTATHVVAEAR